MFVIDFVFITMFYIFINIHSSISLPAVAEALMRPGTLTDVAVLGGNGLHHWLLFHLSLEGRTEKEKGTRVGSALHLHTHTHTQPRASSSRTHWATALLYKLFCTLYLFNGREQVIQQRWEALRLNHLIDRFNLLSFLYLNPTEVCSLVSSTLLTWLLS